jgi:hypothetical protein
MSLTVAVVRWLPRGRRGMQGAWLLGGAPGPVLRFEPWCLAMPPGPRGLPVGRPWLDRGPSRAKSTP